MDINILGPAMLILIGSTGLVFARRLATITLDKDKRTARIESDQSVYVLCIRLVGVIYSIIGVSGLFGVVHVTAFGDRTVGDTLLALLLVMFGAVSVLNRASLARSAQQQQALWGKPYDVRIYLFGFKYGGFVFLIFGILQLCGVITSYGGK